jgi:DMSO/TMAO reductase YedYZ molybdopterin-dependent catalytic subunit
MSEREARGPAPAPGGGDLPVPREEAGTDRAVSAGAPDERAGGTAGAETAESATSPIASAEPQAGAAATATPARVVPASRRGSRLDALAERPERAVERPRRRLAAQSRRDFLLFGAGLMATAAGAWWLLPDRTRARLLGGPAHDRLDTLAARVGLTRERREAVLDRALTFDDDVAEALTSKNRRVRTYRRSEVTALPNNYSGATPGPGYLPGWSLELSGLASGAIERLTIGDLLGRFPLHEQVTRLVCVEGWSAVAWWAGIRFADVLAAFPPAAGARWASIRSAVNLDGRGRPDPYYVSIDLQTARHPQCLLATHQGGRPLTLAHGAPLRLLAPMKLGLKNIKAMTGIAYTASEPPDYWNERGYSKFDGL